MRHQVDPQRADSVGPISDGCAREVLDLTEVTLVDLDVVRFLIRCEEEGIELMQCPSYVREWMLRERAEQNAAGERITQRCTSGLRFVMGRRYNPPSKKQLFRQFIGIAL
jgi:hypothetical protein